MSRLISGIPTFHTDTIRLIAISIFGEREESHNWFNNTLLRTKCYDIINIIYQNPFERL